MADTPRDEDKEAADFLNDLARRVIWIAATLVLLRGTRATEAADMADEVLAQYDRRFDPITPPAA